MPITIGSNLASLMAQRRLGENTSKLATTYERLSSGQRINRASDDAAGLAIANSLNADVRVFNQGIRNLNDGISLLNIADSALGELSSILTRIKELAEQSANGIYGTAQRQALDGEAQALRLEHNRIIATTEFNGRSVFESNSEIRLQDGYGEEGSLAIEIGGEEVASDEILRINLKEDGSESDGGSAGAAINGDGRYIAFTDFSDTLIPGDTNNDNDIFLFDRESGGIRRISVSSGGVESNNNSSRASLSDDGRYIAYQSLATNLVAGDTNVREDIFVYDQVLGATTRVSVSSGGVQGDGHSTISSISGDGRYVAFTSVSTNLVAGDTNGVSDVFVHDRQTGQTTRVSVNSGGTEGNGASTTPQLSYDGRYVVFSSSASNLVAGDTNGASDVFVHDRQTGETTRVSVDGAGIQGNGDSISADISYDGRYVSFRSGATNLVSGDTNGEADAFIYDRVTGEVRRVNVSSTGEEANDEALDVSISGNGEYVTFRSGANNLVDGDSGNFADGFIYKLSTGEITMVGHGNGISSIPSISGDGKYVAFDSSSTNLVAGDTNLISDIFTTLNPLYDLQSLELGEIDISTISDALETLDIIDEHSALITSERGKIGAFQSRVQVARNVRTTASENSSAAESRIRDADIAEETSQLVRLNILQQVTATILAQANQQPALAIRLLQPE